MRNPSPSERSQFFGRARAGSLLVRMANERKVNRMVQWCEAELDDMRCSGNSYSHDNARGLLMWQMYDDPILRDELGYWWLLLIGKIILTILIRWWFSGDGQG